MAPPNLPHVPTAAQLTQLATLNVTEAAALANVTATVATAASARVTWLNAQKASADYAAYIYGGNKAGIYDEGGQNVT